MCGIVAANARRDVLPILMEGLGRLEYRGYDSAGLVLVQPDNRLVRARALGKVKALQTHLDSNPIEGHIGIAHTRWATHGEPAERNAHPHISNDRIAVVHNGIIENYEELRESLIDGGYRFESDTDTEVIAHLIDRHATDGVKLVEAIRLVIEELDGAYAIAVVSADEPEVVVLARRGSPLVIGAGIGENFAASDAAALLPVTRKFMYLEEGDIAEMHRDSVTVTDRDGAAVTRDYQESTLTASSIDKGAYRHYMQKEIFEQPQAIADTWRGRMVDDLVQEETLGPGAAKILDGVKAVQIVACGTSYHAGLVSRYWIETLAKVPCNVELASEFRYRSPVVSPGTLLVTLSQSGETADTLAALRFARTIGSYVGTLSVCNVPQSSLVRESDLVLLTRAGPEIGVASTKAFTTQLLSMLMLTMLIARRNGFTSEQERVVGHLIRGVPGRIEEVLLMDAEIVKIAERFAERHHALFLGRGPMYPIAMEGALKLKEISYIHAEAYAAGELKHGPLALVDEDMPVITVAPNNELLDKLKSNLQEVRARGGELIVFADREAGIESEDGVVVVDMPHADDLIAPIVYTVPLQLLSYHVAVLKGTDIDQPRNLAKSVTVE